MNEKSRDYPPESSKAFSPNWHEVKQERIPLEDALRNGVILANGIFGTMSFDRVIGNPIAGIPIERQPMTRSEQEARKLLVGYLHDQGHTRTNVAQAVHLKEEELDDWGWNNPDWFITAQEQAVQILAQKAAEAENASDVELTPQEREKAMDRILDIVLVDAPSFGAKGKGGRYEISRDSVLSHSHFEDLVQIRIAFILLSRGLLDARYKEIGKFLGGRDHSTIIHHVVGAERRFEESPEEKQSFLAEQERVRQILKEEGLIK